MHTYVSCSLGLLLFGVGRLAFGYCLMTTCDTVPTPDYCIGILDENGCSAEGQRLSWANPCLSFSVYERGSERSGITSGQLEDQIAAAFEQWQTVICNDGDSPRLRVERYPRVQCNRVGYYEEGPNQNLWIFREEGWTQDATNDGTYALTTLTIDSTSGQLLDADVELNAAKHLFTLSTESTQTDLSSIVIHETGHVLGVGHSPNWKTSTMASGYEEGSLEPRSLEADDTRAICTLMPPGEIPSACDAEPLGGFSTQCEAEENGCCTMAPGLKPRGLPLLLAMLVLGLGFFRRR